MSHDLRAMSDTSEDRLATLNRLIGEAEGRCVAQTALINALVMKEERIGQAMDDLEEIEDLLTQMRVERDADQRRGQKAALGISGYMK